MKKIKLSNKKTFIEFNKSLSDIDFIAQLIIQILKDIDEKYIFLKGDIGSGKTTLVKCIAKNLGIFDNITSPTFNKMNIYSDLVHIDAYNMNGQTLEEFENYFDNKFVIIEWFENLNQKFNMGIQIEILYINDDMRKYIITWKE